MKISIAASILILLMAALIGVPNHQRMVVLRESHGRLVATAAQLGVSIDSTHPDDPVRVTKRSREGNEVDAKAFAADFIAYAREMDALQKKGDPPDTAQQSRRMEIMGRMTSLDAAQLKMLVADFRAAENLDDGIRQGLLSLSIMTVADDQPQTALDLLTGAHDLFKGEGMSKYVVSSTLTNWAKNDPMAALDWVKKNSAKFPDLITDDARRGMISGTAAQDPKLAFKLIGDLGIKEISQSLHSIVVAAHTPEERTATLTALREHLATLPDDENRAKLSEYAVRRFALSVGKGGFESGTRWIGSSNFTTAELVNVASGLSGSVKSDETGQWIGWLGEKLPPGKADDSIRNLVSAWTRNDYQAAGTWLAAAPDGPTKNTAIHSYAITISEYEPATAAQWALTLPPGNDRDHTLLTIYRNWPEDDTAAREAFKQEHGIK